MATPQVSLVKAVNMDIKVYVEDTTKMAITASNTDDAAPVDLSTAVIKIEIKTDPAGSPVVTLSTANGKIIISGAGNNIITIAGWETLAYSAIPYVYDMQVTRGVSVETWLNGQVITINDVTT